jgi:SAM-dependent methyltransferase
MSEDLFGNLRAEMMAEVTAEAALTVSHTGRGAFDERVIAVLARVPRHEFVPVELQPYAYLNRPLPIGYDKTVSQPFIVALMTDLLELDPDNVVLEIGAGAGYQAAVLAELTRQVYSVDIIEELAQGAEKRLRRLGCGVRTHSGAAAGSAQAGRPHGDSDRDPGEAGADAGRKIRNRQADDTRYPAGAFLRAGRAGRHHWTCLTL